MAQADDDFPQAPVRMNRRWTLLSTGLLLLLGVGGWVSVRRITAFRDAERTVAACYAPDSLPSTAVAADQLRILRRTLGRVVGLEMNHTSADASLSTFWVRVKVLRRLSPAHSGPPLHATVDQEEVVVSGGECQDVKRVDG